MYHDQLASQKPADRDVQNLQKQDIARFRNLSHTNYFPDSYMNMWGTGHLS